jgi:hypothetical protein
MNTACLRASGTESALLSLRAGLGLKIDCEWKKGDARQRGRVHETSGFNACVVDVVKSIEMMPAIRRFLGECRSAGLIFASEELTTEIDIGVTVGTSEQFTASVFLTTDDLKLCAEMGLPIRLSAYPASDDGVHDAI